MNISFPASQYTKRIQQSEANEKKTHLKIRGRGISAGHFQGGCSAGRAQGGGAGGLNERGVYMWLDREGVA